VAVSSTAANWVSPIVRDFMMAVSDGFLRGVQEKG